MEMKYAKSSDRLLDRDCVSKGGLDLFKQVLGVSVCQKIAELRAVKVGGQKNHADLLTCHNFGTSLGTLAMGQPIR